MKKLLFLSLACASSLWGSAQNASERTREELVAIGMNPDSTDVDRVYTDNTGNACILNGYASDKNWFPHTYGDYKCPPIIKTLIYADDGEYLKPINLAGMNVFPRKYETNKEGKIWFGLVAMSIYSRSELSPIKWVPIYMSRKSIMDPSQPFEDLYYTELDELFGTSYNEKFNLTTTKDHPGARIYKLSSDWYEITYPFTLHAAYVKHNDGIFRENTKYINEFSKLTQEVHSGYGTNQEAMKNEKGAFMLIDSDNKSGIQYDSGYNPWIAVPLEYAKCTQDVVYEIYLSNDLWINADNPSRRQFKFSTNVLYYYKGQLRERNFTNEDARHIMMRKQPIAYHIYIPGQAGGEDCTQPLKEPKAKFQTMFIDINTNLSGHGGVSNGINTIKTRKEIAKKAIRDAKAQEQFEKKAAQGKPLKGTKKIHKELAEVDADISEAYYDDLGELYENPKEFLAHATPAEDILLRLHEKDPIQYIKVTIEGMGSDYISVDPLYTAQSFADSSSGKEKDSKDEKKDSKDSTKKKSTKKTKEDKKSDSKASPVGSKLAELYNSKGELISTADEVPEGINISSTASFYSLSNFEKDKDGNYYAYIKLSGLGLDKVSNQNTGKFDVFHYRKMKNGYHKKELEHAPLALRIADLFQKGKFNAKAKQFYAYTPGKALKIQGNGLPTMHNDGYYRISDTSIQVEFEDTNYYFTQSAKGCYDGKDYAGVSCDYASSNEYKNALDPKSNTSIQTFPFAVSNATFRAKDMTIYEFYKKYYEAKYQKTYDYENKPADKEKLDSLVSRHCRLDDNTNMFESNVMDENGKIACHSSASQFYTFDKVKNCKSVAGSGDVALNDKTNSIVANSDLGMFLNASGGGTICVKRDTVCEDVFSKDSCPLKAEDYISLLSEFDKSSELDLVIYADNDGDINKFIYNDKRLVEHNGAVKGTTNDGRNYVALKISVDEETLNTPLRKALDYLCEEHHCVKTEKGAEYEVRNLVDKNWNYKTDNTMAMLQQVVNNDIAKYALEGLRHTNTIAGGGEVLGYDDRLQFPQFNVDIHACAAGTVQTNDSTSFFALLPPNNPSAFNNNAACSSIYNVPVVKSFIKFDDRSVADDTVIYEMQKTKLLKYFDRNNALASYDYEIDSGAKCTQNGPITYCTDNEAGCKKAGEVKASGNQPTKPCYNDSKGRPGFENLTKLKSAYGNTTHFESDTWTITNDSNASYTKDQITCYGGKFECLDFSVEFNKQQVKPTK